MKLKNTLGVIKRHPLRSMASLVFIYVLSYGVNSSLGGYFGPTAGALEYAPGMAFHTLFLWQPYLGYSDEYNSSLLGRIYSPAVYFDQHYVHRPYDLARTNDASGMFSRLSQIKWHPKMIEDFERSCYDKAIWRNRCVEDRFFCLQSALNFHGKDDTHFIALLLQDAYHTNAILELKSLSEGVDSKLVKKHICDVIDEIEKLNQ